MSTREPAGIWVRVSTGGQDEANQWTDVLKHCVTHGYRVAREYELNDKSASKGEQQGQLDQVIEDLREGTIKVIVCWHSDRMERRGSEALFKLLRQVRDAGGRIESVKEPLLGTQDLSGEALTALGAVISHQYTVHLAEQVKLAHDRIRANGAVGPGGTPWGYVVVGEKYQKQLVASDLCREIVPQMFQRCIDGNSCRTIAMWLDSEEVPPKRGTKWNEGSVLKILHNMAYAGRWQNEDKTRTVATCEAVIPMNTWARTQKALKNRPARGPVKMDDRPLLANLKCGRCADHGIDSPMFRIRLKSRSGKYYYYYRCTGRGAQRKGCGNMTPYDDTEEIVHAFIMLLTTEPHRPREWVDGESYESDISNVKQDMREAVEAEQFDKLPELQEKLADLRDKQEHATKGHYEYRDTGMTVGAYFHSLDYDGQREYLKTRDIQVEKVPKRDGVPGIRLVIDGEDYGAIRLDRSSGS